jgi:hypothetical protein
MFKEESTQCSYLYLGVTVRSAHSNSYYRNPIYALLVYYGFLIVGNFLSCSNKPSIYSTHAHTNKHTVSTNNALSVFCGVLCITL